MSSKTFARRLAWTCLVGFAVCGITAAWTGDVRFGLTAAVLLATAFISAMTAAF